VARGDAQANLCRQLSDSQPPILLQRGKDLAVYGIHSY
jgi:hypothetical protein